MLITVMRTLEAALGRSKRQIQRILRDGESDQTPEDSPKNSPKVSWKKAREAFQKAAKILVEVWELEQSDEAKALSKKAEAILTNAA